jgi:hypothetical protein
LQVNTLVLILLWFAVIWHIIPAIKYIPISNHNTALEMPVTLRQVSTTWEAAADNLR